MNASTIIDDNMTLDEKLAAIDAAMANAVAQAKANDDVSVDVDPALLTICDGCE